MDHPVVAGRCGYEPAGFSAPFGSGTYECASVCIAERHCSCVDDHLSRSVSDTEARVIATVYQWVLPAHLEPHGGVTSQERSQ